MLEPNPAAGTAPPQAPGDSRPPLANSPAPPLAGSPAPPPPSSPAPPPASAPVRLLAALGFDPLTVAHGVVTLVALSIGSLLPVNSEVIALLAAGVIFAQICLATAWATWSAERWLVRTGRLVWQMAWLYLLLLLVDSFWAPRHTAMLWTLPLAMAPFLAATWLPAWILRWFRWHLARPGTGPSSANDSSTANPPARKMDLSPLQFRLADAWRWCTLLCALLAVMPLFRNELQGWDALGYAILLHLAWLTSAPAGLVVSLLFWLAMAESSASGGRESPGYRALLPSTIPRRIVAALLLSAWCVVSILAAWYGLRPLQSDEAVWRIIWLLSTAGCATTLLTAFLLRRHGWRLVRRGARRGEVHAC